MIDRINVSIKIEGLHPIKVKKDRPYRKYYLNNPKSVLGQPIEIIRFYSPKEDITRLKIMGSLRKWYLGRHTTQDLTFKSFLDCVDLLARELGLTKVQILSGSIHYIELGVCIRFYENMGGIINSIVSYKNFESIHLYRNQTVKFGGDAYKIGVYDKYTEIMCDKNKIYKKKISKDIKTKGVYPLNKSDKRRLAKKINETNFCLRFEVSVSDIHNSPPELNGKIKSLGDIQNNWNFLLEGLQAMFQNFEITKYNLLLTRSYVKNKGRKELNELKTYALVEKVGGVKNYVDLFLRNIKSNHRSEIIKKELEKINNPSPEMERILSGSEFKVNLLKTRTISRIKKLMI